MFQTLPPTLHLGRPPILLGTGHGAIPHVHGAGRGSIGLVGRFPVSLRHICLSQGNTHTSGCTWRRACTRRPLSLPRPRPASPVPADPSSCRISQKRAITWRQHNTLAASRRCLVPHPTPHSSADVIVSVTPTSQSCTQTHPLVLGYSRHV